MEKILGLFLIINSPFQRNLHDCRKYLERQGHGFKYFCVYRDKLPSIIRLPRLKSKIVSFELNQEEVVCFSMIREAVLTLWDQYTRALEEQEDKKIKKIGVFILSTISYLRQSLIEPRIALNKLIKFSEEEDDEKKDLKILVSNNLYKNGLKSWISNSSLISTRMGACINCLENHKSDVIIIFGSFSKCLLNLKKIVDSRLPSFETFFYQAKL